MMLDTSIQLQSAEINTQSPSLSTRDLLHYASLLSGLGAGARAVAEEQAMLFDANADDSRTCIDGGSPLMFSVVAPITHWPETHGLRVAVRYGLGKDGISTWKRTSYFPGGLREDWQVLLFSGEPAGAWTHVQSAVEQAKKLDEFRHIHAILGPHSRFYSVHQEETGFTHEAWVSWQLDRTLPADTALAALGMENAWLPAIALWENLLGFPPNPRLGPWSISVLFGKEHRLRLGSSSWARRAEDPEKRRRLATTLETWLGDRRYGEALYKLIASCTLSSRAHSIGRAVELEFSSDGQPLMAEFYLSLP